MKIMDEYNRKHEKSKKSSYYNSDSTRSKHKRKHSRHDIECKTPPLPKKYQMSMEELMKKRESLKKELRKYETSSSSVVNKDKYNNSAKVKEKHSKESYTNKKYVRRTDTDRHNKINHDHSPEHNYDYAHMDSEDEENIIKQRREQRKKLLAKFNESQLDARRKSNDETMVTNVENKMITENVTIDKESMEKATDMFSEKDDFVPNSIPNKMKDDSQESNLLLTDNWDDSEGYYNIRAGDMLNNRYTIKDILGQGVFANVVRAQDNIDGNDYVAIKIIRNNEVMYKTGLKELSTLQQLNKADPDNKYHCVRFIRHFMHKNHLCLVLESLHMDLRCILKRYGRNHGLNMRATVSYSRQLLLALRLLRKTGIVHADIKPDNILVNEKKNILKLCDFGSATTIDDYEPTPYLVSRFYRAPEIILGIPHKNGVDIWSAACTIYEMATGKILFTGSSNNKMLKCFMDLKGRFSSKMIRKGKFKDQHFNYNNNFLLHKRDNVTEREKVVEISNIVPTRDLNKDLKKTYNNLSQNEEKKLSQLSDLLDKMLMLDSKHRLSVADCLRHAFFQDELPKV